MDKKVAILGCGSTGYVTAAYLTMQGWEVTLCDTEAHSSDFTTVKEQGGIWVRGALNMEKPEQPYLLTNDFKKTLQENQRIIVCVSASRHLEIAKLCKNNVRKDHMFLISPGNLGSVIFRKYFPEETAVGEISGNLWACRKEGEGRFVSALPIGRIYVAAYPHKDTDRLLKSYSDMFEIEAGENIIEITLNSPNVASHLPSIVLNAVTIENNPDFCLFLDGLGGVLVECIDLVENEIDSVLQKAGLRRYKEHSRTLLNMLMKPELYPNLELFRQLDGPSSFHHRYLTEDAECGVAMMVSLAKQLRVSVKLSESFLQIAGAMTDVNYLERGRTLKNLGLDFQDL